VKYLQTILMMTALTVAVLNSPAQAQQLKGKILVVVSSETVLPLKDGKTYQTGYYLNELMVPAQKFVVAGYELVFANPKGNTPEVDPASVSPDYFGGDKGEMEKALRFRAELTGLVHPQTLRQISQSDLDPFKAVFVPGGPAPTIDLMANPELGSILNYFHQHRKTTVLLCHGPIALLATVKDPISVQTALRRGDEAKAHELAAAWIYRGYKMTVFSDEEEDIGIKQVLHGEPLLFPQHALEIAGAAVSTVPAWKPNVIQDRELITGQNPGSDKALMAVVLPVLDAQD
jgi:putative intracellular protease/amidase